MTAGSVSTKTCFDFLIESGSMNYRPDILVMLHSTGREELLDKNSSTLNNAVYRQKIADVDGQYGVGFEKEQYLLRAH